MKFFEHSAKRIFRKEGINTLSGVVVYSPEEAMQASSEIRKPVVLKSFILIIFLIKYLNLDCILNFNSIINYDLF